MRPVFEPAAPARALPAGTRLNGDHELLALIHAGPYGLTYLAEDLTEHRQRVVKEYLPDHLATRAPDSSLVYARPGASEQALSDGLTQFVHEARLLIDHDCPGLVPVLQCWQENNTAYMTLPHLAGSTLRRVLAERGEAPDEGELRAWLRAVLDTLATLHASRRIHGRITPDTILISPNGPMLLGFGAGRHAVAHALGQPGDALAAGYAPIEQYESSAADAQGPWTDLYAVASIVYAALTGRAPMAAKQRHKADRLTPLRELVAGRFTPTLLGTIDAALAVRPADRPQNVAAFRAMLNGQTMPPPPPPRPAPTPLTPPVTTRRERQALLAGAAVCALAIGTFAAFEWWPHGGASSTATAPLDLPPTSAGPARQAAVPSLAPVPAPMPAPVPEPEPVHVPVPAAATAPITPLPPVSVQPSAPPTAESPAPESAPRPQAAAMPRRAAHPSTSTRCVDLLKRASLNPLTDTEAATLKKECQT